MSLFDRYIVKIPWWTMKKATYLLMLSILGSIIVLIAAFSFYIKAFRLSIVSKSCHQSLFNIKR